MKKEIIVLCNTKECLNEITSGDWSDLGERDIYTCNRSWSFFRTNGRHFNMQVDEFAFKMIPEKVSPNGMPTAEYVNKIQFICSNWDKGNLKAKEKYPKLNFMKEENYGSSGINAVIHSMEMSYGIIHLIGQSEYFKKQEEKIIREMSLKYKYKKLVNFTELNYESFIKIQ